MAILCDPNALVEAARCFECIPQGQQAAVQTYLLLQISGLNLTVDELLDAARCFRCADGMLEEIQAFLLCAIVNK